MSSSITACRLLWDEALAGTTSGQRWIVAAMQSHGPCLVTMLWRILGNESDVCDAYQDTFLQLASRQSTAKPGNVKAFLFRTASNVAISILRRKKSRLKAFEKLSQRSKDSSLSGPADDLDAASLRESLREHVANLPEQFRNVILLRDLAELSYGQVASILSISIGTARVYRCRGIGLLAKRMARDEGE